MGWYLTGMAQWACSVLGPRLSVCCCGDALGTKGPTEHRALPNWTYVCIWGGAGWGYNYVRTIIKSCISIKACNHIMQIVMTIPSLIHSGLELLLETYYKKIAFAISFGQFWTTDYCNFNSGIVSQLNLLRRLKIKQHKIPNPSLVAYTYRV